MGEDNGKACWDSLVQNPIDRVGTARPAQSLFHQKGALGCLGDLA